MNDQSSTFVYDSKRRLHACMYSLPTMLVLQVSTIFGIR